MNGSLEEIRIDKDKVHTSTDYFVAFDGIVKYLRTLIESDDSAAGQKWASQFLADKECPACHGKRLKKEALAYRVWDKDISEVSNLDIDLLRDWLDQVEDHLEEGKKRIAHEIIKELRSRVSFLLDVGLNYLSLNRQSATLSGGESQRIRLATQIGSQLVNVLYILDEPSIGLPTGLSTSDRRRDAKAVRRSSKVHPRRCSRPTRSLLSISMVSVPSRFRPSAEKAMAR